MMSGIPSVAPPRPRVPANSCSDIISVAIPSSMAKVASLVLRRMDRRGYKSGLVRANPHGTKSGSGAPLRRGFSLVRFDCAHLGDTLDWCYLSR